MRSQKKFCSSAIIIIVTHIIKMRKRTIIGFGFLALSCWDQGGQSAAFQIATSHRNWRHNTYEGSSNGSPDWHNSAAILRKNRNKYQLWFASPNDSDDDDDDDDDTDENNNKDLSSNKLQAIISSSYQTALCIVPPEHKWDTIQRARHFAEDKTYHQWPPAIRLFHPFCERHKLANYALDVAKIIEDYQIEPFRITLNRWTVMPLPDTLQSMLAEQEKGEISVDDSGYDGRTYRESQEYKETQALIASEERKGIVRKKVRDARRQSKERAQALLLAAAANNTQVQHQQQDLEEKPTSNTNVGAVMDTAEEPETMQAESETIQPRATFDEFNGPSMIAVEPDEESSQKLHQLREIIKSELLAEYGSSSGRDTSSSLLEEEKDSEHLSEEDFEEYVDEIMTSFRPLVPIGAYPTVDAALSTARKLKGFWDPLSFTVTDLHFISQVKSSGQKIDESTEAYYSLNFDPASSPEKVAGTPFHDTKTQQIRETGAAFGCDAIVMLMGEELEMDDESNELLANLVWEEGTPGGFLLEEDEEGKLGNKKVVLDDEVSLEAEEDDGDDDDDQPDSQYGNYARKLNSKEGDYEDLLAWLDGDDDDEEESANDIGTDVVIGRTHIFSGEKRIYAGMPASVTAEEEDGTFSVVFDGQDFKI